MTVGIAFFPVPVWKKIRLQGVVSNLWCFYIYQCDYVDQLHLQWCDINQTLCWPINCFIYQWHSLPYLFSNTVVEVLLKIRVWVYRDKDRAGRVWWAWVLACLWVWKRGLFIFFVFPVEISNRLKGGQKKPVQYLHSTLPYPYPHSTFHRTTTFFPNLGGLRKKSGRNDPPN